MSTNLGTLSWNGISGSNITATTDNNGEVIFNITNATIGTSTIHAQTSLSLQSGTRIDPGTSVQKIVLSGTTNTQLDQSATKEWVAGNKLVVKKFHDYNHDGIQNGDEPLIAWNIKYRETGGTFINAVTPNNGSLVIAVDPTKTYEICEVLNPAWDLTTDECFSNLTAPAEVSFGNAALPAILIRKFHDLNQNGTWDNGEPPIDGWGFQVLRDDNGIWSSTYSGNTANGGLLGYTQIPFNRYLIREILQPGWIATTTDEQEINVNQNTLYTVTFGNYKLDTAIGDYVWYDLNKNGLQDDGETGVQGITVYLLNSGGSVIGTDITDSNGYYSFNNLQPGSYTIQFDLSTLPSGYTVTLQNAGDDTLDSDADTTTGLTQQVTLVAGESNLTLDMGIYPLPAKLGNYVWEDTNGNGLQDNGEPGIEGVTVNLWIDENNDGVPDTQLDTTQTDASGMYMFSGLDHTLVYIVHFVLPGGRDFTLQDVGNDTLDSDANPSNGLSAPITLNPGEYDDTIDAGLTPLPTATPTNTPTETPTETPTNTPTETST
ncbi:MAG TPA: SdrD B-like domain-containing protein, partial [Anaerolineales bacterium]|nr:SdrD B-like domain-containing protein [Anaerolineales bacterium]